MCADCCGRRLPLLLLLLLPRPPAEVSRFATDGLFRLSAPPSDSLLIDDDAGDEERFFFATRLFTFPSMAALVVPAPLQTFFVAPPPPPSSRCGATVPAPFPSSLSGGCRTADRCSPLAAPAVILFFFRALPPTLVGDDVDLGRVPSRPFATAAVLRVFSGATAGGAATSDGRADSARRLALCVRSFTLASVTDVRRPASPPPLLDLFASEGASFALRLSFVRSVEGRSPDFCCCFSSAAHCCCSASSAACASEVGRRRTMQCSTTGMS